MLNLARSIFIKNKVHNSMLLSLNHHHFLLQPGESLVEYGDVATPWQLSGLDAKALRDGISGKTWAFFGDKLLPIEFRYSPNKTQPPAVPVEFVEELGNYLHNHDLANRFGITLCDTDRAVNNRSMYETTVGQVSVQVPRDTTDSEDIVWVAWKFSHDGRKVVLGCKLCCKIHGSLD